MPSSPNRKRNGSKKTPTKTIVLPPMNWGSPKRVPFSQHLEFENEEDKIKTSSKKFTIGPPQRVPVPSIKKTTQSVKSLSIKRISVPKMASIKKATVPKTKTVASIKKATPPKTKSVASIKKATPPKTKSVASIKKATPPKKKITTPRKSSPQHQFYLSPESKYKESLLLPLTKPTPFKSEQLPELLRNQPTSPYKKGLTKVNLKEVFPKSRISLKYLAEKLDL